MSVTIRHNLAWAAAVAMALAATLAPWSALALVGAPTLLVILPGIAVARWLGVRLDWRDARAWAIVLCGGLALSPLAVFTSALIVPFSPFTSAFVLAVVSGVLHLTAAAPSASAPPRIALSRRAVVLMTAMLVVAAVALAPVRTSYRDSILPLGGAYRATDWVKHYGIAWQIEASGLPPLNLLVSDDPPRIHTYYLFYHLTVAMLDQWTAGALGLDAWLVIVALAVMAAGLLAVYALASHLWRSERAAFAALLCVTFLGGLDVLPSLEGFARGEAGTSPWFQVDAWDVGWAEVSTFLTAFTNVPQHMLALAILLVVWLVAISARPSWRVGLMAGLLLVSALGHSLYIVFAATPGATLAVGVLLARAARAYGVSGVWPAVRPWLAGLLAAPVAWPLAAYLARSGAADGGLPVSLWVRTAGVGLHRLSTGTPVEALFPDGGAMAQLLDLPTYFLIELGAAGALAVVALARWRGVLWRGAWLIGGMTALSSLLVGVFVRSTLGWNDLGIRGILPFQAIVALWAGGGWLALTETADESARSKPYLVHWRWQATAAAIVTAALLLGYQRPWVYDYDLLRSESAPRAVTGLYAIEGAGGMTYRWSGPEVNIPLDGATSNQAYAVRIAASTGSRPASALKADAVATLDGVEIGRFTPTAEMQPFVLALPPEAVQGRNGATLRVQVASWRPADYGAADRRELGLLIESVSIEPVAGGAPALPPPDLLVAAITLGLAAGALSRRRIGLAAWCAAVLIGALAFRPWLALGLPYVALALAVAACVRRATPALTGWLADSANQRAARRAVCLLALGGVLTTAWQITTFDVAKFLPAWDAAAAQTDARSLAYGDALRTVRERTPPGALLQVDPALQGTAVGWSVTAERRSRLFLDEVFLYQLTPAERNRRRALVEAAFAPPESAVICGRMRALGLDMILVEKASGHPWLDDRDTPDGCMRTLYENAIVVVLAVER
ncbi:MAG: hypothetical protein HZB53_20115 [Chloroflexi bacterium]|nr:hypothetical protein [Chloroflexota bacterium]